MTSKHSLTLLTGLVLLGLFSLLMPTAQATLPLDKNSGHEFELLSSENLEDAKVETLPGLKRKVAAKGLKFGAPIFIRIFKQSRQLELWIQNGEQFELFRSYPICEMSGTLGPKLREGDEQAPEGFYWVNAGWMHPRSSFHLAMNVGYPNEYDRSYERTGSAIMIHGECSSSGCFAMTDPYIEEIYLLAEAALLGGQDYFRVQIFPFRMTEANMRRHGKWRWADFWQNLKEGYDFFEQHKRPPNVEVENQRYVFSDPLAPVEEPDTMIAETNEFEVVGIPEHLWDIFRLEQSSPSVTPLQRVERR
ncbi:MAG: murein L,D-transpeptidase family protein [Salinisphaeraceae bacterium]|nr:murein L,D-transpeptidase family protein [Salinisphaeraceae bacterium]